MTDEEFKAFVNRMYELIIETRNRGVPATISSGLALHFSYQASQELEASRECKKLLFRLTGGQG
jgi:hypothetical protein